MIVQRVDSRKDGRGLQEVEKAGDFHSFSEFDDGSGETYVIKRREDGKKV